MFAVLQKSIGAAALSRNTPTESHPLRTLVIEKAVAAEELSWKLVKKKKKNHYEHKRMEEF